MVQRSSNLTECKEILRRYLFIMYCIICVLTPHKCSCLKKKRLDGDFVKTIVKSCCSHHSCLFCFVASRKCNDRDAFVSCLCHICVWAMLVFCFLVSKVCSSLKNSLILPTDLCLLGIIIVIQLQIVEYYDFSCPRSQTKVRACVEEVTWAEI